MPKNWWQFSSGVCHQWLLITTRLIDVRCRLTRWLTILRRLATYFFPHILRYPKSHWEDNKRQDKKIFLIFFSILKISRKKTEMVVHRFLRLTNHYRMSVRLKFRQNLIHNNMVETEFRIFLLVKILTPEETIYSIENFIHSREKNLHFQKHHDLGN